MEALAYTSVYIKELKNGTATDSKGNFKIQLEAGKYDVVITMLGFKTQVLTLTITKDYTLNVILEEEKTTLLGEVQVIGTRKDHAEEIVRNVIRNKETNLQNAGTYSCNIYIRATDQNSRPPKLKKKAADTTTKLQKEMDAMNMAEVYLKVDHDFPNKIKEERTAVKIRGNSESLFYLTTTDGDFNFYKNLVQLPALSAMPMLSPISTSGLVAYKYKTLRIRKEKSRTIYTIKVTPTKLGNALVTGEMEIIDSAWVLLSTHFELPKFHLTEYDYFSVDQQYEWVNNKAWMPLRQDFTYLTKAGKKSLSGRTIAVFSDYNIDTSFSKRHFTAEISSTTREAYEKDSSFWETIRKEPLTEKEVKFINYRDSIKRAHTTVAFLDSVDRYNNKITLKKIFIDGIDNHNWRKERLMIFASIPDLYLPLQLGGGRIGYNFYLHKKYKNKKNISLNTRMNYGIRNKDIQGAIGFSKLYNPFSRGYYFINVGREFGQVFEGDAWINQIKRSNIYLKEGIEFGHSVELLNGLVLENKFEYTGRRSVADYKTNDKLDSSSIGRGLRNNQAIRFDPYTAFYNTIGLQYTPGQKYIREPKEKVILGSKWPTIGVSWRKGIPRLLGSKINFDYLEFGITQKLQLGLAGESRYTFISGSFLSRKDLRLVDFKFMRRGDPLLFSNPTLSFQSLDSTFPAYRRFYEGHYLHQFHGAILNKIPLLKKLNLLEVAGGGILYVPERNLQYGELFFGVEKIIRFWRDRYKLGGYVVTSVANKFSNPIQFKIAIEVFNKRKNSWY
ncbi:MAG: carboxypeptidase-like regulatory domain-containing protein [Ferruginibacter sp.]|nr:carboxypeptidase-like regulatory domain-containing protein [Ferruginibacter sp.]